MRNSNPRSPHTLCWQQGSKQHTLFLFLAHVHTDTEHMEVMRCISNIPPGDLYHQFNICWSWALWLNIFGKRNVGIFRQVNEYFMHFTGFCALWNCNPRNCSSPSDWMLSAAVHVWAWGRGREGAEVEWQGSGGGPGGVPPPESIKHLNIRGDMVDTWLLRLDVNVSSCAHEVNCRWIKLLCDASEGLTAIVVLYHLLWDNEWNKEHWSTLKAQTQQIKVKLTVTGTEKKSKPHICE